MTDLFLAQFFAQVSSDIGDWLQTIVILLVVAGSVFGAISKRLIAWFSPKSQDPPGAPVMPEMRPPAQALKPPAAKPLTPQVPPPFVVVEEESVAQGSATGTARRRRKQKATTHPSTSSAQRKSQRTARPIQQPTEREGPEQRLGHLRSTFEEEGEKFEELIEEDIGHLITQFDEPGHPSHEWAKGKAPSVTGGHVRSRLHVRRTVREAIIVAEILAPPLAMRDPDQSV